MLAYRAFIHTTTPYTPAYLMFGHKLMLLLVLLSPIPPPEAPSLPDCVRNLRENLRTVFASAHGRMKDAQRRQKEQYDQHISSLAYPRGRCVWLDRSKAGVGEPAKLHCRWQGPHEVVFVRSSTIDVTVHYNQLKPASHTSHCEPYDMTLPLGYISIVEQ
ncbi:uncharacterized protein DEA37_0006002 [Paragonimus westermani]|uniref:Integrase zinc-binding domain-containing protein n=1 Tax=Paragonimus westermani TaxID=34504 RepID=A0A5J4P3Q3_9TREM|nr:uncharacterized protein DEA37_0006002 [Paragonimus westermani]